MTDETLALHLAWRFGRSPSEIGDWQQTDLEKIRIYMDVFVPHYRERFRDVEDERHRGGSKIVKVE